MCFISDEEKNVLSIKRMIFHIVGSSLVNPILLNEIVPLQYEDFFLERVKSALRGNLFEFQTSSNTERILRLIAEEVHSFTKHTQKLAEHFQKLHNSTTSKGVFFVFELSTGNGNIIYALIKYDNEDVVRYILKQSREPQVPRLERFQESFVRKPDSMQKIALVRLDAEGGRIMVKDRSNVMDISRYFKKFLGARRINSPDEMSEKLVKVFTETYKTHRKSLPKNIQYGGVSGIYQVLCQEEQCFDPENCEPLLMSIFGCVENTAKLRQTFKSNLKKQGLLDEAFKIHSQKIKKPIRYRLETREGTEIIYNEEEKPKIQDREDGRKEIVIVTADITRDDVDIGNDPRSRRS